MTAQNLKRTALWGALAATLGSAILAPSEEAPKRASPPPLSAPRTQPGMSQAGVEPVKLVTGDRPKIDEGFIVDMFEPRLPPPPSAAAAPAPTAPALPFVFMGTVEKDDTLKVYLVQGDKLYEVTRGETFAEQYRLDAVGAEGLTITYLPLNVQQRLATGGAK